MLLALQDRSRDNSIRANGTAHSQSAAAAAGRTADLAALSAVTAMNVNAADQSRYQSPGAMVLSCSFRAQKTLVAPNDG